MCAVLLFLIMRKSAQVISSRIVHFIARSAIDDHIVDGVFVSIVTIFRKVDFIVLSPTIGGEYPARDIKLLLVLSRNGTA